MAFRSASDGGDRRLLRKADIWMDRRFLQSAKRTWRRRSI